MAHAANPYPGWSEKDPPCPEDFLERLEECKTLWNGFFSRYKELYQLPPFLDQWVAWQYRVEEPARWNDMAAVCGFDKPRASDDVHDKMRTWKYKDVKLAVTTYGWYFDKLLHADGAMLSPSEVRGIPGLDHTEEEWEHYKPLSVDRTDMRRIVHLRCRVYRRASRGASHRCKMKWGPDGQ